MAVDGPNDVLKVLLVEDSPADAELVVRALHALGRPVQTARVSNADTLHAALAEFDPDVVLSDFSMPGFSGQEALRIVREQAPHIPFLFVSGTIGEELAIEALQRGAMDYVLKNNLRRLPSAVVRALDIARDRCERLRMEQALRESEERFRTIVESSRDWIWENEWSTRITYSNGAIAQILGYQPEELRGTFAIEHMLPEDREEVERCMPRLIAEGKGWHRWQLHWCHRNGSIRVLESTAIPRMDDDGQIVGFRGVDQDVTERLQQEARIRQLGRIHAVLSALGNATMRIRDRQALLERICRIAVEQGEFKAACIGLATADRSLALASSDGDPGVLAFIAGLDALPHDAADAALQRPGIVALHKAHRVVVRDVASAGLPPAAAAGLQRVGVGAHISLPIGAPPWGVLGLYSAEPQEFDAEEIALLERLTGEIDYAVDFIAKSERLEYLAFHNPATGIANRSAFREQVKPLVESGPTVVAVLDVQRFARVNESRGRTFGDDLLRQIGQRLARLDGVDCLLAHPEADNFLLAYRASGTPETEVARLEALLEEFDRTSFVVDGEEVHVDLRGGIAIAPDHGTDGETLELNAMVALAEAGKRNARLYAFSDELSGRAARRIELERNLRHSIAAEEFELHYQPKFDVASHRLVGAEALLRWHHPDKGLVSPAEFIPVLEETGLIVPVGRWAMRRALATALQWRIHHPGFRIAVNVSARELRHARFLEECRALLEPHLADQLLDIEVTESLLMDDIDHSIRLLQALRDLGCRVSIDDFGTGYSSLNYLARLPADEIKIDQSFVAMLAHSPDTMGLVTNIITLAHSLSLKVVAEGVEEEEQAKLLRLLRCDMLQGYLLGRPLPAAEFEACLFNSSQAD